MYVESGKMVQRNLSSGQELDVYVDNGCVDTGRGRRTWEMGSDRYTQLYVK